MKKFCIIALMIMTAAIGSAVGVNAADELNIGDMAIDFPEGKKWFDGEKISIQDNLGKKITLVYFMKPGCGSCDKFAPHLYRLMLKNPDTLSVVGVTEFDDESINEYLLKKKGDYPIMQDRDRSFMAKYIGVINKYPYIAIIDKEGKLAWFGRGKFHSHVTEELERVLPSDATETVELESGKKYALAVGVDYSELTYNKLPSEENNSSLAARSFEDAGYQGVVLLKGSDALRGSVEEAVNKLAESAKKGDTAVFFFSGEAKPVATVTGSVDLKLYLSDGSSSLQELIKEFKAKSECEHLLVVIDANNEKSTLDIWEDIAEDVGKGLEGVTLILSAARWDRSMLSSNGDTTIFADMFAATITNSDSQLTPYKLWRDVRDKMSAWSRPSGVLQSPFIANAADFVIGKTE